MGNQGATHSGGTVSSKDENKDSHDATNIILNHDFSKGMDAWQPSGCNAFVASADYGFREGISVEHGSHYAVVTNRKEYWHHLAQNITGRVSPGLTYSISAIVGVSGSLREFENVQATLKLEFRNSAPSFVFIGGTSMAKEQWQKVEGTFLLFTKPDQVVFYLEGPSPGVDLLIQSVVCSPIPSGPDEANEDVESAGDANIILNHDFSGGMHVWHSNCCAGLVVSPNSGFPEGISAKSDNRYAVITNRKEYWQGLEQEITSRVSPGCNYAVYAFVGLSGPFQGVENVQATLKLKFGDSATSYLFIGRTSITKDQWKMVEGTFSLTTKPDQVIFYLEGPSPGVDLLIKSVVVRPSFSDYDSQGTICISDGGDSNIILNPRFEEGPNNWTGRGCQLVLHNSMGHGEVIPMSGKFFASATERTDSWNGIQQEITGRVQRKLVYEVNAVVRIFGNNVRSADVRATLWVQSSDLREQYIGIGNVQATNKHWVQLNGKFLLNGSPSRVVVYLEGPPEGTDILLDSLIVKHPENIPPPPPLVIENAAFGVNILSNSDLNDGTNGWFPLGNCTLTVGNGSPRLVPPLARDSLGPHEPLGGCHILVTNRTESWMGPAQMITDKLQLHLTYQVSAWVRIGSGASGPQNVSVTLGVDSHQVNGGWVEVSDERWHDIGGSFRIEKQPAKVMVYVDGPDACVDLMVAGLQIFPVDRKARFRNLKIQTDKIRKRNVILKFTGLDSSNLVGTFVRVKQTNNTFPFGSCLSRTTIDNEDFVDFFTKYFNCAVFENELKWYWTESEHGNIHYSDADELLSFCTSHNIAARGHSIFSGDEKTVQPWIRALESTDLMKEVQNRITSLLTRYNRKFMHYDVSSGMLHGSFYEDRLGKDIHSKMFKTAHELDPSATLFVNDYHIEDGSEKCIRQILNLQEQGAPVGGIGIQCHIDSPVGPIVCSALDKLGVLGLPIWFTALDVASNNEYVRADDLEVMLREAFGHPAVDGVMLWGFWELFMNRDKSHLVNAEGDLNEAGRRYLALKQEWLSHAHGHIDKQGQFAFRGFEGSYEVEIITCPEKVSKNFVVDKAKGQQPLVISIKL